MDSTLETKAYKLTQYSHGAGCGCKIAPSVLDKILTQHGNQMAFPQLLVGNDTRDDAAVFDLGDGTAAISTTDFFMPIVDDAHDFGRIASVNAISDIYAMGGKPLMAIAILGWPINQIPAEVANQVIEGARQACQEAGIPLAGGHSIDSPEPIFGLAVTGRVKTAEIKENGGAKLGDKLFLTKPLGVGILSTAQKKGKRLPEHDNIARDSMAQLNKVGVTFAQLPYVHAMTDVTGFGLMGHLSEMCEASDLSAVIELNKVPLFDKSIIDYYIKEGCIPGGTNRNFASYGHKIASMTDYQKAILCDPQTSGGLLVSIDQEHEDAFKSIALKEGLDLESIGYFESQQNQLIRIL